MYTTPIRLLALPALLAFVGIAHAQAVEPHDAHHATPVVAAAASALPTVEAEVRRIDLAAGKVSLKHGDIPNLDMPGMTMVFKVKDPAWLGPLKVGDHVRFTADEQQGAYVVMSLERMQ
jgi:Cu/Ag efflux protein CusF